MRSIKVSRGRLYLNGEPMNVRGVGVHEDNRAQGFAVDNAFRDRLVDEAKAVGATVLRTHYPMHPLRPRARRPRGAADLVGDPRLRGQDALPAPARSVRALAAKEMRKNIETNLNHPSVMMWSVGNELSSKPGPVQGDYIRRAAEIAKDIDPTRPSAIAFAGYPTRGLPDGVRAARRDRRQRVLRLVPRARAASCSTARPLGLPRRACAAAIRGRRSWSREFGAEANREGPVEEKGTYAFQQDFVNYHLGVFAQQAVAERRALLGAERVPREARLGGRQPAPGPAGAPEGRC